MEQNFLYIMILKVAILLDTKCRTFVKIAHFPMNFAKFSRAPFSNRTPPVAASEKWSIVKPITLQRAFFTQVTGDRVSDHYAKNVYTKVFL